GIASGANNAIRELGGVFGVAVLGAVFSARGGYTSGAAFVTRLSSAIWGGGAVVAVAPPGALGLPPVRPAGATAPTPHSRPPPARARAGRRRPSRPLPGRRVPRGRSGRGRSQCLRWHRSGKPARSADEVGPPLRRGPHPRASGGPAARRPEDPRVQLHQ